MGILLSGYYWKVQDDQKGIEANTLGNQIADYVSAVIARVSQDRNLDTNIIYSGFGWLKAATCNSDGSGNPHGGYLPCGYKINSRLLGDQSELDFTVTLTDFVDHLNNNPTARRQIMISIPQIYETNRIDLSAHLGAVVFNTAKARYGLGTHMTNINDTHLPGPSIRSAANVATHHGIADFKYNKETAKIVVEALVTNTDGIWLQIDGSNSMVADISYNKPNPLIEHTFSKRGIVNVARVENFNEVDKKIQESLDKFGPYFSGYTGDKTKTSLENSMRINASNNIYLGNQHRGLNQKKTNIHVYDLNLGSMGGENLHALFKGTTPVCREMPTFPITLPVLLPTGPNGKVFVVFSGTIRHLSTAFSASATLSMVENTSIKPVNTYSSPAVLSPVPPVPGLELFPNTITVFHMMTLDKLTKPFEALELLIDNNLINNSNLVADYFKNINVALWLPVMFPMLNMIPVPGSFRYCYTSH